MAELQELQALGGGGSPLIRNRKLQPAVMSTLPGGSTYATKFEYAMDCPTHMGSSAGVDQAHGVEQNLDASGISTTKATAVIFRQRRVQEFADVRSDTGYRQAASLTKRLIISPCPGDEDFHVAVNIAAY
eukprot:SAG31_NODE_491_length_14923_cov_12.905221_12_plen_130_part_00